jgi:hypothetical protein
MVPYCVLCGEPTTIRTIGAMIVIGDPERPEGGVVCRRCAALSSTEQRRRRDRAMIRMLSDAMVDGPARHGRAANRT